MAKADYPFIRAWHAAGGSQASYVDDLIARAKREKAPVNACFLRHVGDDRVWATIDEVTDKSLRETLQDWVAERYPTEQPHA